MCTKKWRQRDDLDSYFEQAVYLADANPRDSVMLFAARRAASFALHQSNGAHLVRWLLYSARRTPSCMAFVAEHLAATFKEILIDGEELRSYILQQIPLKAEAAHTEEVAWLLFWAREMGLKIPAAAFDTVKKLRSSIVGLLTLDIRDRGLVDGDLKLAEWKSAAQADGLKSEMWLMAYEATKKGWWKGKVSSTFASEHELFGDIWSKGIEFYDPKKKARKKVSPVFGKSQSIQSVAAGLAGYPE